ncbi:hypothetical protein BTO04_09140 [Polaribacter sp. SA4-10]|uniref:T9SS type A sorting domain-containing protein n=1 Tax=Polaribacter sp. SA4-10 TaxID=754397 RepID=UPI000B3CFDB2|nr:T9SS type A sorting domain-containing protein [Polaribacter sp. SA4-10]ARV06838.1 hypothetical protein BTO04_09140 [Polaribacter sp. SA4-10]
MKKSIVILILLVCCVLIYKVSSRNNSNKDLQEKYELYLKNHILNTTLTLSREERLVNGIPPNKYLEQKYLLEINPHTGRTHPENTYKIQKELKTQRLIQHRTPGDGIDNQWVERGPNNVGGRTRALLFDPNDVTHKRVFAGGVSGGLWVNDDITDETSSWISVGIDENLSVTCITVDPNDSQIMYLGTGEVHSPAQALGNGIWKSTDGGDTWTNVYKVRGVTTSGLVPGTYYTTDIIVRDSDGSSATNNDSEVFAAIGAAGYSRDPIDTYLGFNDYGIFKSTDNGANWNRVSLTIDETNVAPNDLEIGLDNTLWLGTRRNVHGKGGGLVYSSSDGSTFTLKHTITNAKRTEIAVSSLKDSTVYVLAEVATLNGAETALIAPYLSILKTEDAFATSPTVLTLPNDARYSADDFTRGQAFYDLVIEVDPTNDAIAYVGGINLFRTTDSGGAWSQISKWSDSNNLTIPTVHADQHALLFHPTDANVAIIGNDGGVFYASSLSSANTNTTAINARNKDYNITQFYHGTISQSSSPEYILGGAQDNGTQFFDNAVAGVNATTSVFGGDGTKCFIDKDGGYMIVTYLYNRIIRFDLPYTSGSEFRISSDRSTGSFVNAMDLDENLDVLYTNGTTHLARFTDITTSSPIRTNISDALLNNISAIKVSPFTLTSSKVFVGTSDGTLAKVENANTENQTITDVSGSSFLGSISSIEFGANEDEIMVTFHNFGVTNVWYSADGGTNWANKEGDLPDFPVKCILMNPLNNDEVIIGTELGVWNTNNFKEVSPKWNHSYNGMSNVTVTTLGLRTSDNTILAASYGRGMFTGKFTGNTLTTWTGTVDSDWNNVGNWSNGLPTSVMDVKILETTTGPAINTTITVANLSIETGASLILNALGSLTIKENLTNEGTFIIYSSSSNSGSLIVEGNSTGNITYNRVVTTDWHLTSSPVIGQNYNNDWVLANSIASGSINTSQRGIATYNNDSGHWHYMLTGESSQFTQGTGYSTLRTTTGNLSYTGTLLTTVTTKDISKGTTNSFNLIGNVYASYIPLNFEADNTNNFLTTNTSLLEEATIWLWNGTIYNPINQATSSQFIPPGQGFFVKSKSAGGMVSFTPLMQSHQVSTFFKTQQSRPSIRLSLTKGKDKKYAEIFFIDNTTAGFDNGYDSSLYTGVSSNFEVFTKLVNQEKDMNLSIQSIPKDDSIVVPIGIIAPANTEISIRALMKNRNDGEKIYIEDKELGIFTRMHDDETTYRFKSEEAINGSGRFYLHTSSKVLALSNTNLSSAVLFYTNEKIHFSGLPSGKKAIRIYNTIGTLILKENIISHNAISVANLPKGAYIVLIDTEKGTIQKKIVF